MFGTSKLTAHIKSWFGFNSFWAGTATSLVLALVFIFGDNEINSLTQSLDDRIQDSMFRVRGPVAASGRVVIVDLDEQSLKEIGQWPWPRDVVAQLLRNIGAAEPLVIGLDIVFAEPDRTSPRNYLPLFQKLSAQDLSGLREKLPDNDAILGETIGATPTVLGYFFQLRDDGMESGGAMPFPVWSLGADKIDEGLRNGLWDVTHAYRPVMNTPEISGMSLTEGFFNSAPDSGGAVRRVPLLIRFKDTLFPSLTFEMLREGLDVAPMPALEPLGFQGIKFGERFIWTDRGARLCVNFRGGHGSFPYISAVDVLHGHVDPEVFKNNYVLIGTSSAGLSDNVATPYSKALPGVEVHATIIDNVLKDDEFRYDAPSNAAIIVALVLIGGTLLSLVLRFAGPISGLFIGILFVVYLTVGNYYLFFLKNRWVGLTYAVGAIILVYIVSTTVNYFSEGRQKKFIRNAFGRYVSPQVVAEMIASPAKLTLEGEEKELTVMFSDIRDFTSLSERLTPRDMRILLNEYLTSMTDIIMAGRGTVDKFIGDAIMAIWGAPLDDDEHAANAVRATMKMLNQLEQLNRDWKNRGFPEIKIGAGINTGLMNVGNMGSDSRFDYTVIGDNVNLASRLEGLNKIYGTKMLISQATKDAGGDKIFCRVVDNVRVKGKLEAVRIYEPLCEGEPDFKLREMSEAMTAMFDAYEKGDFKQAAQILEAAPFTIEDGLRQVYRSRLKQLQQEPPASWDGVFVFNTK